MHTLSWPAALRLIRHIEPFPGFRSQLRQCPDLFRELEALLALQVLDGIGIDLRDKRVRFGQQLFDILIKIRAPSSLYRVLASQFDIVDIIAANKKLCDWKRDASSR